MAFLKKVFLQLDDWLASVSAVTIIVITVIGVFMRFVVGDPLKWTEEVSLFLFVWLTYLGASSVMKQDAHVKIDLLIERSSPKTRKVLAWIRHLAALFVFVVVFVVVGYELATHAWEKVTPILRIPYTFVDLAVVMGGVLGAIHTLRLLLNRNQQSEPTDEKGREEWT